MSYTIVEEDLDHLASSWSDWRHRLRWGSVFVLPAWLKAWWEVFGGGAQLYLRTMRQGEELVGLAPLLVRGDTASFIGSADVCDYSDFVLVAGQESNAFSVLLDDLKGNGIRRLDLGPLRPDSTVLTHLVNVARGRGYGVRCQSEEVSLELDLPATWSEYLGMLNNKQRHEVRRKLRRLSELRTAEHECVKVGGEVDERLDVFLHLFSLSGNEKADFMTARMETFFRLLARAMAEIGLLRFGTLKVDRVPAAMTMGFDYNSWHYLYNSAYDPRFGHLSVGLICKALCLKESIKRGMDKWDFLKGGEPYKYQLGGQEVPLYKCRIALS